MQIIPLAEAIGQGDCEASRTIGVRTFVNVHGLHPRRDTLARRLGSRSEGWKTRSGQIFGEANDVLARAAGDFKDRAPCRQDLTKDIKNKIAIARRRGRILAMVAHIPHALLEFRSQRRWKSKTRCYRLKSSMSLRFIQETRADNAAAKLKAMIKVTATAIRDSQPEEIPLKQLVPGDVVKLSAGDMIPGDVRQPRRICS